MINLDTAEFFFQHAFQSMRRNWLMALAAICNISVAFGVLGAFVLVAWNLQHMAQAQASEAIISAELSPKAVVKDVQEQLRGNPLIKRVEFRPRDQALAALAKRMGLDLPALKRISNPLPDAFLIWPKDPANIPVIAQTVRQITGIAPGAEAVHYGGQTTQRLLTLANGAKISAAVLTVLLGGAALLIMATTIGLTIYARRREVRIMQLVGATNWFIRVPYVIEGVFQGVIGAGIAAAGLLTVYAHFCNYVGQNIAFVSLVTSPSALILFGCGVVLTGMVFGAVGALVGLRRYLSLV